MLFLRSLLYFIGSIISLILIAFCGLFLIFSPYPIRYTIISKWAIFCVWWLSITLSIKIKVVGKENIPKSPCIIVSNHQSTFEVLAFQTLFPAQTWVLKKELLWLPIFGWNLALLKPIVIDRGYKIGALKKVISQGCDRLKNGIFVIIFPEGTRQPENQLGHYQNGAVAIAKKSGHDLLPVYHNSGKLWPKGEFVKQPGTITVVIGKAITAEGRVASELTEEIRNWTKNQSLKIRQ
jgi:1-acyl-sn-glycerol-3-phosphate acyltransferase